MYYNKEHKERVENRGDGYVYMGSYHSKEHTIDGKYSKNKTYIRVKCPYCGKEYDVRLDIFLKGTKCTNCCNEYENSFAYYIQHELQEPLNKYWDWKNNTMNPYFIYKTSPKTKIWIKCVNKNYHGIYKLTPNDFYYGNRCPYCNPFASHKIHPKDSFGALYPDKVKYWSKNNKKSPYEIAPKTGKKYKFICKKCGKEFEVDLHHLNRYDNNVFCKECNLSQLEYKTKEILIKYNIKYKAQVKYNGLIGLGGGSLSYDFYLPNYNLLIECQGQQHEKFIKLLHEKEENFEKQLEHDRRKREYAKQHDINLLEIWYYDIDNIEDIIINKLNY